MSSGNKAEQIVKNDLEKSGIDSETAQEANIRPVPFDDLPKYKRKFKHPKILKSECLAEFPYPDTDGYVRIKRYTKDNQEKEPKYLQKPDTNPRLYIPKSLLKNERILKGDETLIITEGEKKALKGTQDGFLTLGIGGIFGWKKSNTDDNRDKLISDFEKLNLSRNFLLVYDSDIGLDHQHYPAFRRLSERLEANGAKTVKILTLPDACGEGTGLDDFLTEESPEALNVVIDEMAHEPLSDLERSQNLIREANGISELKDAFENVFTKLNDYETEEIRELCTEELDVRKSKFDDFLKRAYKKNRPGDDDNSESILNAVGVNVVGQNEHSEILLSDPNSGQVRKFPKPKNITYEKMLQLHGEKYEQHVDTHIPDHSRKRHHSEIVRNIAKSARKKRLAHFDRTGQGIYRQNENIILVVTGTDILEINLENGLEITKKSGQPVVDERLVSLRAGNQWIKAEKLENNLNELHKDKKRQRELIKQLLDLVSQWNWKNDDYDAALLTGMVPATIVQDFHNWRPCLTLVGPKETGKSLLMEVIDSMLGDFSEIHGSGSTEAGIRQSLFNYDTESADMFFTLIDEFENYDSKQRKNILAWIRETGRGGHVTKGTAGQEHSIKFPIRHCFWTATTEFGGDATAADLSRFIQLHLEPTDEKFDIPSNDQLRQLGEEIIATAILNAERATNITQGLLHENLPISGRMAENHAVPYALLKAIAGEDYEVANPDHLVENKFYLNPLDEILKIRDDETRVETDEEDVLEAILNHTDKVPLSAENTINPQVTVGQMISKHMTQQDFKTHLESLGIKIINPERGGHNGKKKVFFFPSLVRRNCLKDTDYDEANIEDYLLRLPDSEKTQQRINGNRKRGVSLPLYEVLSFEDDT